MSPDQRRELGAFIRARREALPPAEAGQPTAPAARRRTPGLRREEVAQLCAISTTWYTWLEQGRDISLSPPALARIADILRLTAAERTYLFELTRKRDPAPPAATDAGVVPPELAAALQATDAPAYLLDRLWSACAWNKAAAQLFSGWLGGGRERNLLRYVFFDPTARDFIDDWENRARRLLAEFRADTAQATGDPAIKALVGELMQGSAVFARFWNIHAVLAREGGARSFRHPRRGLVLYEQVTLIPAAHSDCKLVMLLPQARSTARHRAAKR